MDYEDAVKKIQETGSIHLNDLRALKYHYCPVKNLANSIA